MASILVRCDDPRYPAVQDPPSEANYLDILAACQSFTSKILWHAACSGFAVAESNENAIILDEKKFIMFQSMDAKMAHQNTFSMLSSARSCFHRISHLYFEFTSLLECYHHSAAHQ